MKNFLQVNRASTGAKKNFNFNFKHLFVLGIALITCIKTAWGASGVITAASTTDLGKGNTPRYVVEQVGVGRLMKNAEGTSTWSVSDGKLTTGSSKFALQTYNAISSIVITGYGTSNGRTFSSMQVGTTTENYAAAAATGTGTMSSTVSSQTITITPSSTIAANSYVEITLSGNINIYSVELVYAGGGATTYSVTYDGSDADSGTVPTDGSSYASGATVTVKGNTGSLARTISGDAATFEGWNTNSNMYGGTHYNASETFSIGGNTTLYAVWGYSITWNKNGGDWVDYTAPSYYIYGQGLASLPAAAKISKSGYELDHWELDYDKSTVTSIADDATGSVQLNAIWSAKEYTVTLNNQSATTAGTESVTTTYNANTNLTSAITCPTKTSKVFAGYFTATNGGGVQLIDPAGNWIASAGGNSTYLDGSKKWMYDGKLTLYACWMEYASTFDIKAYVQSNLSSGSTTKTFTILGTNKLLYSLSGNTELDNSSDASNAYDGLKFKNSGDYILFLVQANSSLKLYFGYTDTKPKISINGGAESNVDVSSTGSKTVDQEVDFGSETYDRLIKIRTVTSNAVVLQKIEITAATPSTKRIYMEAANGWNNSTPYFYAKSWGVTGSTVLMTQVSSCETNVFYADIPSGDNNILFTRQSTNSGIKYKDETGNYNQSVDINCTSNDKFTFNGTWDKNSTGKSDFNYGTYSAPSYTVTYNKNGDGAGGAGSVTGSVPTDSNSPYSCGDDVTVLGNTGSLALAGYSFNDWNTAANGTGDPYSANDTYEDIAANTTFYAQWTREAPTSVSIEGDWAYFPGQTISLTAETTGGTSDFTYQWQKCISSVWTDLNNGLDATDGGTFSGVTTDNLQISGCTKNNCGTYRCVVSKAGLSVNSSDANLKIYTLNGNYTGESFVSNDITYSSGTSGTVSLELDANSVYEFKINDNYVADNRLYGSESGNYIISPVTFGTCYPGNQKANIRLFTGPAGDYTFTVNIAHVGDNSPYVSVSVAYPSVTHPAAGYAYFEKPDGWTNVYLYWYTSDSYRMTDWSGAPEVVTTTEICGTTYYYAPVGTTFDYLKLKGNGTNEWTAISTTGCSGKYMDETTYASPSWESFVTYTISYAAGTQGTGSMSATSGICPDADQALPACSFTPNTGYEFDSWTASSAVKVGGETVTTGIADEAILQDVGANVTLTAQWKPRTYTISYKDINNAAFSGQPIPYDKPTTHTYGTATTLPTAVRDSYVFDGWYTNKECTEGPVTSLGATDYTAKVYLYAKWTAMDLDPLADNTLYKVEDMVPDGITPGSDVRRYPGVSENNRFNIRGTSSSGSSADAGMTPRSGSRTIDGTSFTNVYRFDKPASGTKGTNLETGLPDNHAIQFKISAAGKLDIYCYYGDSIYIVKDGGSAEQVAATNSYQKVTKPVTAGTYYLYSVGVTDNQRLYGLKFTPVYTLTNVVNTEGYGTVSPTSVANIPYGTSTSSSSNTYTVNGTTVTATPAATTAQYTYAFSSWSSLPATVTANSTVTANFTRTARSYTVTLNTNDGTINSGDVTSYTYGTGATLPTDVTKDDNIFMGWYDNEELTGEPVLSIANDATGDKEYWAKWLEASASICVDLNTTWLDTYTAAHNGTYALLDGVKYDVEARADDESYLEMGWLGEEDGHDTYFQLNIEDLGTIKAVKITIDNIPAIGEGNNGIVGDFFDESGFAHYNLSSHWDDGDNWIETTSISTGTLLLQPVSGDNNSFAFQTNSATIQISQICIYYEEASSFTVTYADGGKTGGGAAPTDANSPYDPSAEVTVLGNVNNMTKGTDVFRGWTDGTTFFLPGQKFNITSNVTLTAVWESESGSCETLVSGTKNTTTNATIDATTGTIGNTSTGEDNGSVKLTGSSSYFTLTAKTGYTPIVAGDKLTVTMYNKDNSAKTLGYRLHASDAEDTYTTSVDSKTTKNVEHILLAADIEDNGTVKIFRSSSSDHYEAILLERCVVTNFTVSFADGNTAPASHLTWPDDIEGVPTGKKILQPTAPTASGYIFGGWYTNANCTTAVDFSTMTISADKTLYAKWTEKSTPAGSTLTPTASSVCSGSSTTLTLNASTSGVEYELYEGETKLRTVTGTGSALSLGSTSNLTAAKTYTVKTVENDDYKGMTLDVEATVSIATATSVSVASTSLAATVGEAFTIDGITASGTGDLSYQWYSYTSSGGAGESLIAGAESDSYTFTPDEIGSYYFKCEVTGECGSLKSDMITVTASVAKTDPTVYELSGTTSVCEGDEATLTLEDSDDGVTYQLYKGGVAEGDPVTGTGSALEWEVTADGTYTVKAEEDEDYNEADMDGSAVISYKTATSIDTDPATAVTGHDGVNFTLGTGLVATGEGELSYKWYSYTSSGGADEAVVAGATEATYTTSKSAGTYYYKVEVIATCGSVKSEMITVTVDNKHLLTYDANGGTGAPAAIWKSSGSMTLSSTEPTRDGYRFLGWNTEDDGTGDHYDAGGTYKMGSTAATLYAEWGETATLTWNLNVNTEESSIGTASKASTNARISNSTDMANLANYGSLTITSSAKDNLTSKIETPSTYNSGKYLYVTFDMPNNYEFVPTSISVKVQPVGSGEDKYTILDISDENSHNIRSTATKCDGTKDGKLTTVSLEGDETALTGTVTLKIYVYNYSGESTTNNCYRLGSPITIAGDVNYVCPERATITSPTAPQDIKLYTDRTKTLTVEATPYSSGTLHYQWKKDGVNIAGATSATYTVVGSGLIAGTTYVYTCDVSQTSPDACATVTSPAVTIKAASTDCGYTEFSSAVLTSASTADRVNATLLASGLGSISEGSCKLNGKGAYFGLQLASGSFQVGDSIEFKIKKNNSTDIYLFATTDTTGLQTTDAIYTQSVTSGDNIIKFVVTSGSMLTALNTNKKVAVVRRTKDGVLNQNHSVYYVKVKRYGCPDIYVYDDAADNGLWSDANNWIGATGHGSGLPTIDDRAIITKPITVDIAHATASAVILDQSDSKTGKLTIQPNKGLEVAGTIRKTTDGSSYSATGEADLVLESNEDGNASLIFNNSNGCAATVQMYSKASIVGNTWNWQYVGTPFTGSIPLYNYYGSWMYKWDNGGWAVVKGDDTLEEFVGYCLTQSEATTHVMGGTLVPTTSKSVTMAASTDMVLANSWTAPISIASFDIEGGDATFTSTPATIYLFNTGMAENGSEEYVSGDEAGTYVTVPVNAAEYTGNGLIAPMQGFFVTTNGGSAGSITMNYNDLVRPSGEHTDIVAGSMKAPKRIEERPEVMKIRAEGSVYNDRVVILSREDFSQGFDNGWDGKKMSFGNASPSVYVINEEGGYDAVSAIPEYEGTVVGFRAGTDSEYTIRFEYDGEEMLYLNDLQEQEATPIDSMRTYTFTAEAGDNEARFIISATPVQKVTTGVDPASGGQDAKVRKVIINDHIYIIRGGRMYSVDGALVK